MQQGDEDWHMTIITSMTPNGQITIPRSTMKLLGIKAGCTVSIEIVNGSVVLKKIDEMAENKEDSLIFKAV